MTENTALWLSSKRTPFTVGEAPYPTAGTGEVVIRTRAIAVNPFERLIQTCGEIMTPYLAYPAVIGSDVAGEVVAVGEGVTRFQVGDRVLGYAAGSDKARNSAREGGFQAYTVLLQGLITPLPDALSFEQACVLPLAAMTASAGLFQRDFLAMNPPGADAQHTGRTLLVWGGSTSVGINAIQQAVAAGYDVVATASPRNFNLLKRLGATAVLDYRSPRVVRDLIAALRGRTMAGALAIGAGSAGPCVDVLGASEGNKFVALATPPASFDDVPAGRGHLAALVPAIARMVVGNIALAIRARRRKVTTKFIWGSAPVSNEVGPMIFERFLPTALADGRYEAAPKAEVVGRGLGAIPAALERQRRGVSAAKLVVTL